MAPKAYDFIPIQNFNYAWTDEKLYRKYDLSESEINLIEASIPEMGMIGSAENGN